MDSQVRTARALAEGGVEVLHFSAEDTRQPHSNTGQHTGCGCSLSSTSSVMLQDGFCIVLCHKGQTCGEHCWTCVNSAGATVGKMPCLAISSTTTAYGREMIEATRTWVQVGNTEHFTCFLGGQQS